MLGVGHGTTTSLNGQAGTGLLWVSDVDGFNLRVYKAVPQGGTLELIKAANLPGLTKFTRAVFGDGRVYLGTTQGFLYCLGSPVNPPLTCNSPLDFGSTAINDTSVPRTVQCKANIDTQVKNINLTGNANFKISGLPSLPVNVPAGSNISFQAVFAPISPGPLSSDVQLSTSNNIAGYSTVTPVSLKGVGTSVNPLLAVSPNVLSFEGVITGQQAGGVTQSVIISNVGDGPLTIQSYEYSVISETGATTTPTNTPGGPKVNSFTFQDLPTTIPGNSQAVVNINFDPPQSGNYAVYVRIRSNGGTKVFDVFGTAGTYPKALLEFQAADGSGTWIPYQNNTPFDFGNVFQQQTKVLKMRLTNVGDSSAAALSVTVSKPPFGVNGIIGAQNGVDLAEGTVLGPGQSATASLFCSVPKSQVNVDSYKGTAQWTLNTGDPTLGKLFIQFVCTAITEQVGPLNSNGSAVYRYAGCFKENNPGRQLKTQVYNLQDSTNAKCITACAAQSYTYAGTQYRAECWCGNTIPNTNVSDAECNYDCTGALTESCGGNGVNYDASFISLFTNQPGRDVAGGPAKVIPSVGPYNYTGCFTEVSPHTLNAQTSASADMTIEKCAAFCTGFKYFGLEFANECYCADTITAGSAQAPETDCKMSCAGNNSEICGAGSRLSLYTRVGAVSSSASGSLSGTISATSSGATASPTGPVAVPSTGKFTLAGCYSEPNGARALSGPVKADSLMTVEKCADFCAAYAYMGVEYSTECYCGNAIGVGAAKTNLDKCSMTCGGNALEYCGGPVLLNLYQAAAATATATTTASTAAASPTGPVIVKGDANFTYAACYAEPANNRALANQVLPGAVMTVEKCLSACAQFQYAGIEYGGECWCGNTLATGTAKASAESECNFPCSGNSSQICGAGNRLTMYTHLPANVVSLSSPSIPSTSLSSASTQSSASTSQSSSGSQTQTASSAITTAQTSSVQSLSSLSSSVGLTSTSKISSSSVSVLSSSNSASPSSSTFSVSSSLSVLSSSNSASPSGSAFSVTSSLSGFTTSVSRSASSGSGSTLSTSVSSGSASSSVSTVQSSATPATSSVKSSVTPSASSNTQSSIAPVSSILQTSVTSTPSSTLSASKTSVTSTASPITSSVTSSASTGSTLQTLSTSKTTVISTASSVTSSVTSSVSSVSTLQTSTSKPASSSATTSSTVVRLVPTPGQTINSYVYLGCANETSPRALVGISKTDSSNTTTESCQQLCFQNNYGLAATENGNTCFCGNGLQSGSTLGQTLCNTPCVGNSSETCGGIDGSNNKYLSVWNSTSNAIPPTMVKQVGKYPLDNCYSDFNSTQPILSGSTLTNATSMTVEACVGYCSSNNFGLAGLSYGKTCYCGQSLANNAQVLPLAQCNMLCTGNLREFCGAYQKLLVYKSNSASVDANGVPLAINQSNSASIAANTTAPA